MASLSLLVGTPSPTLSPRISFFQSQTLGTSLPSSSSVSFSLSTPSTVPLVYCGRGDKKTAKGKRFNHSFGNARPRNKKKGRGPPRIPVPTSPPSKDKFEDGEKITIEIDESLFSN